MPLELIWIFFPVGVQLKQEARHPISGTALGETLGLGAGVQCVGPGSCWKLFENTRSSDIVIIRASSLYFGKGCFGFCGRGLLGLLRCGVEQVSVMHCSLLCVLLVPATRVGDG